MESESVFIEKIIFLLHDINKNKGQLKSHALNNKLVNNACGVEC